MRPVRFIAPAAVALLLCAWGGTSEGHDQEADDAGASAQGPAALAQAGVPGAVVVERTLGAGPAETLAVQRGADVRLILHVPEGTELHLHGYDLSGTAVGGGPVVMTFHAAHAGRFAIEAHGGEDLLGRAERALAYVEVRPE